MKRLISFCVVFLFVTNIINGQGFFTHQGNQNEKGLGISGVEYNWEIKPKGVLSFKVFRFEINSITLPGETSFISVADLKPYGINDYPLECTDCSFDYRARVSWLDHDLTFSTTLKYGKEVIASVDLTGITDQIKEETEEMRQRSNDLSAGEDAWTRMAMIRSGNYSNFRGPTIDRLYKAARAYLNDQQSGKTANRNNTNTQDNSCCQSFTSDGSGSSQAMAVSSEDPQVTAHRKQMEASRRQMADFRRKMEEQNRKKAQLNDAADATMEEWAQGNFIEGSESLATEFARQGNAAAAYGTVALGVIAEFGSMRKKEKEEEKRREQEEAQRRRQEELYRQRQEQLEREAFQMLIEQRHLILNTFNNSAPVPLASAKVDTDRIYYFVYGLDRSAINEKNTELYVSNVFEIAQYSDGTWPYQSRIDAELEPLIPFTPTLNGYYANREEAEMMHNEFVVSFKNNEGVAVKEFEYKGKPASNTKASGLGNPLGVSLEKEQDTTANAPSKKNGLGISISPKKKKSNN